LGQLFRTNRHTFTLALALTEIFFTAAIAQIKNPSSGTLTNSTRRAEERSAIARGLLLYKDRCAICHFSKSDAKKIGPGLKGISERGKYSAGGKVDDASMEKWILNGGKDMPPFRSELSASQIRDLLAYLRTL
jgi:mono/diheme cytochrome c family protein